MHVAEAQHPPRRDEFAFPQRFHFGLEDARDLHPVEDGNDDHHRTRIDKGCQCQQQPYGNVVPQRISPRIMIPLRGGWNCSGRSMYGLPLPSDGAIIRGGAVHGDRLVENIMTTACGQIVSRKVIMRNAALSGSVSALQADAVEWQACNQSGRLPNKRRSGQQYPIQWAVKKSIPPQRAPHPHSFGSGIWGLQWYARQGSQNRPSGDLRELLQRAHHIPGLPTDLFQRQNRHTGTAGQHRT